MRNRFTLQRILFLCVGVTLLSATHATAMVVRTEHYELAAFRWQHNQVRIVSFDAGEGFVLRKTMAYPVFSHGRRIVSSMGTSSGALVAVNDGFRMLNTRGAPTRMSVVNGEIMTTGNPTLPGWVIAMDTSGTRAWVARPHFNVVATQGDVAFPVTAWNAQQPVHHTVVAFTARGGTDRYLNTSTCSALLAPRAHVRGTTRTYKVVAVRKGQACQHPPLHAPRGHYAHVVLGGKPVRKLREGARIQLHVDLGHDGIITNVIGSTPILVKHGTNVARNCNGECIKYGTGPDNAFRKRNPRTVIGISKGCSDLAASTSCTYYMVTVDGRLRHWSIGTRFRPLADLLIKHGIYDALNMDGGGSTTMWVRQRNRKCESLTPTGCLLNRPTYGQRDLPDAVVMVAA